jgi:hypothetical protein
MLEDFFDLKTKNRESYEFEDESPSPTGKKLSLKQHKSQSFSP